MKPITLFLCILFSHLSYSKADLEITITCLRDSKKMIFLSELKIYKDGEIYSTLSPNHENKLQLNNLPYGQYSFVYNSIFEKEVILELEMNETKKYTLNINIDYLDYSKEIYVPFIDRLTENETYSLFFSSYGCFHSRKDTLSISRNLETYTLLWGSKTLILNSENIAQIRHFELELNCMTQRSCTTTDYYCIRYNGLSNPFIDGSCWWNGLSDLKKKLFSD